MSAISNSRVQATSGMRVQTRSHAQVPETAWWCFPLGVRSPVQGFRFHPPIMGSESGHFSCLSSVSPCVKWKVCNQTHYGGSEDPKVLSLIASVLSLSCERKVLCVSCWKTPSSGCWRLRISRALIWSRSGREFMAGTDQ